MTTRRRRSPQWIRETDSRSLHGIAGKLNLQQHHNDLTDRQEWLWGAVISELEWRFLHPGPEWPWCTCSLCFTDDMMPGSEELWAEEPF